MTEEFIQCIRFISEIDQLKQIIRQNYLCDGSRHENDAEHSWHIAIMAYLLRDYAPDADISRVMIMLLAHDLVEVYAGDTYCYDDAANLDKQSRETAAANKLFGLLPEYLREDMMSLWLEFEGQQTKESRFANILDRLQPAILNYSAQGKSWIEHGVSAGRFLERNQLALENIPDFAEYLHQIADSALQQGWMKP